MSKKLLFYFLMLPFTGGVLYAQLTDNFSDGDFISNPPWAGNTADFIVNASAQLQSNNAGTSATSFYLSTPNVLATSAQWEFYIGLKFTVSSANYADVFLTASASDLTLNTTTGYFIRIGNTNKEISLYRKNGATNTLVIDGADNTVNTTNNIFKIRVIRNAANQWILSRNNTGTGNTFVSEPPVTDASFLTSSFFGILIKESTAAGPVKNHYFDDIEVKAYVPDITPPVIQSATVLSASTVDVLFNEPLDNASSQATANYFVTNSLGAPATAVLDANNNSLIHLTFAGSFANGINNQLTVSAVKDIAGNALINQTISFTYFAPYTPQQYDVVIDEIMADPTPAVGLPNNEWVELRNTSGTPINLQGWRIADAIGQSGLMPNFILGADSFVMICSSSSVAALSVFGAAIPVSSFPSLDNIADQLYLMSPQNKVIHSVSYSDAWYQNALKKDGGWTLEMIDTKNPCTGISNWKASTDLRGGSPAKKNVVDAVNADNTKPKLLRAYAPDNLHLRLVFDEPLDSLHAATASNYTVSDGIGKPANTIALAPAFDRVELTLATPLVRNKVYLITAAAITDCVGNAIGKNTAKAGLSETADSMDIVINEVLFNPPSNGTDYVEIYNRGNKIIDLKQTYIANRNATGAIGSIAPLSTESNLLFPQDFMVITEDASIVKAAYITQNPDAFAVINTMPSFNDDEGNVIILNAQGNITDELKYSDKWHFKLIDNTEGVALERIDYNAQTQTPDNWHSAAASNGYGTPTYKNSQFRINQGIQGDVKLSPEIVSPDNDGQDDFATLEYNFPEPGYVANITIFDASGRPVRYLQRNALCGTKGSFSWDGLGEKSQRLPVGVYVIFTEVFNLKGNRKQFKNAIVLARRN